MTRNDTPPQTGGTHRTPVLSKKARSLLLLVAVVVFVALSWYLVIAHGPLAFLMLVATLIIGYMTVSDWDHRSWLHGLLVLSIVGSIVYGFCQLNAANTQTRRANVVFCSAFRGQTSWNGDDVWKIKTERGDFVVQGGTYNGKLSDDDAAAHSLQSGSVYLITYHGGHGNDRYMTGAELVNADGSCGVKR